MTGGNIKSTSSYFDLAATSQIVGVDDDEISFDDDFFANERTPVD